MTLIKISKVPRNKRTYHPERNLHRFIEHIRTGKIQPKIEHEEGFVRIRDEKGSTYMLTEEHYKKLLDPPPIGVHIGVMEYVEHDGRIIKVKRH